MTDKQDGRGTVEARRRKAFAMLALWHDPERRQERLAQIQQARRQGGNEA